MRPGSSDGSLAGPGNVDFKGTLAWTRRGDGGQRADDDRPRRGRDAGRRELRPPSCATGDCSSTTGGSTWSGGRAERDRTRPSSTRGSSTSRATRDITGSFGFFGETLLHNTGTIRKSAGAGESELGAEVDNDGTIEAAAGTLALRGELLNYSEATASLTSGAFVARDATLELPGEPLQVNAATIVLDGAAARLVCRPFFGDPAEDALSDLVRNAGAGELRLEGGAELTTSGRVAQRRPARRRRGRAR